MIMVIYEVSVWKYTLNNINTKTKDNLLHKK